MWKLREEVNLCVRRGCSHWPTFTWNWVTKQIKSSSARKHWKQHQSVDREQEGAPLVTDHSSVAWDGDTDIVGNSDSLQEAYVARQWISVCKWSGRKHGCFHSGATRHQLKLHRSCRSRQCWANNNPWGAGFNASALVCWCETRALRHDS